MKLNGVTVTIGFELSSMNRDQSIGNITTLKKLSIGNEIYTMISRPWMTNKFINTLVARFPDRWKMAPLTVANKVLQHELLRPGKEIEVVGDIIRYAELDAFGYMSTAEKKGSGKTGISVTLTRKAPVSATKAISLYSWKGDTGFYANHAMVSRYNKTLPKEPATPDPYSKEESYSLFKFSVNIDLRRLGEDTWYLNKDIIGRLSTDNFPDIETQGGKVILNKEKNLLEFKLNPEEKVKRVLDILEVLKDGLIAHGAGEDYGIVPLFLIAAPVKIPVPIFHHFVRTNPKTERIPAEEIRNVINNNGYIIKENGGENPVVFVQNLRKDILEDGELSYYDYEEFKNYIKTHIE